MNHEQQHRADAAEHHAASEKVTAATVDAQSEREKFVRRTFLIVVLAVMAVTIGIVASGFLFTQGRSLRAIQDEFALHEANTVAFQSKFTATFEELVEAHEVAVSKEFDKLQRRSERDSQRIKQLIRFIRQQGLTPPSGGGSGSSGRQTGGKSRGPRGPRGPQGPRGQATCIAVPGVGCV